MASTRKPRNLNKRFGKFNEEIHDKGGASLNRKTRKRKLTDMLGSQWSKDELDRFYEAYRKHGKDWKQIASAVRNRSAGMVEALYNMNKAYLSLPEGHATAAGLIAMMTDHYNILEGTDSEHESNDASRTSRKTPKRGRGKFKLMSKASDGPYPDLLQCQGSTSGYGCFSLLKKKRSGGGKPRVVGKRTPRIPVPYFLEEDRNKIASPSKQCLRAESLPVDDDGVHVAAMALTEASQRGGSPQISRTPSRRRGHVTSSPVPSGDRKDSELKIGESKIRNCQLDDDHLEGSLGSREAENGEFFNNACISETRQKSKKLRGKGSRVVEDDPLDDDREACSGTEEGTNVRKNKDETMSDFTDGIALQTSKGSKRRSQQLFFGDESSALDALQTLADLSLNILLPASTIESESSIQVKEEKGAEAMAEKPSLPESLSMNLLRETINTSEWKDKGHSTAVDGAGRKSAKPSRGFAYGLSTSENKQQIGSSNSKIKKRKTKHTIERVSKCPFEVDLQKSEHHNVEVVPEDGKRSTTKVKRVCQIPVPKHGKSSKLQEGHPTISDLERAMTDGPEVAAACSAGNDQILYTKVRSRRKRNLQEALAGVQVRSSESATEEHPERYSFCRRPYDLKEKLSHSLSSCLLRRWCKFEWFYSAIDYPWFAKSEFVEYLNHVRLGHIPRLTRVEWGVIRSSLGKPRRLSYQFLKQEREKLEQYRESVRSHYSELRAGARDGLPTDLSRPLSVGQRVVACHPRSREVHDGSVLTVDRNRCRVQFDRPELGVEFVLDVDCMPVNLLDDLSEPLRREKFSTGFSNLMLDEQKEIKLRDSMKFSLAESLDVAEATSHVDSYSYPMNTLMIQAKGDTLDAILQAKAAVNDVAVAAQHAMYNQPFTLAQIQAREADIRALADLSRALDKKEALIMELRQMNEEVSGIQKSGEHIKDLESFRKQYAMVLLQLRDVNDQVASALMYLRQRNTYERNSSLPFPKSSETSGLLGCLNSSALLGQDSGSNVVEVIESSKQKAKAMVDVAVQAMCSLKRGEDAFSKIGEALELASNRNPISNSSIMAVRNGFADQSHDNSACEDHIASKFEPDAAQATSPNFSPTAANEIQFPSELISSCVATLFMIQVCSERQYPPAEVAQILDSAVASLQPCCPQNLPIFREIETCMGIIKNQMLALVPTPTTSLASDTPVL